MVFTTQIPTTGKKIYINQARNAWDNILSEEFPIESPRYMVQMNFEIADIYVKSVYMKNANIGILLRDVDTGKEYNVQFKYLQDILTMLKNDSHNGVAFGVFKTIPADKKLEPIM